MELAATKERPKPISAPKVGETRGRRPTFTDYKDLAREVEAYFTKCDEDGVFPDEAGMYVYLKIFKEDLEPMLDPDNPDAQEYERILKRAKYRRESWLSRNMVQDNKMANGCFNMLKQEANGGYSDRGVQDKTEKKLKIVFPSGIGVEAFQ